MTRTTVIFTIMIFMSLTFISCSISAPDCSNDSTKNLVSEIANDRLRDNLSNMKILQGGNALTDSEWKEIRSEFTIIVENIRTQDFEKKTGKYSCAADLIVDAGEEQEKHAITYTSELVEDKEDQFYVSVQGI